MSSTVIAATSGPVSTMALPSASEALRPARVRLRLTRRGRVVFTLLAALPIVIGAFVFALNGGGAVASGERGSTSFQHVTVQTGESLWSIAERVAPRADPRDVIADLVNLNSLESAVVSPGQELAIPANYAH